MPLNPDNYDPNKIPDGVYSCNIDKVITKTRNGELMLNREGIPQLVLNMKASPGGRFVKAYVTVDDEGINRICRAAGITTEQLQGATADWFLDADYATGMLMNRVVEVEVITREQKDPTKKPFTNVFVQKPGDAAERAAKKRAKEAGQAPPPSPSAMPFKPQAQSAPQGPPRPPLQGTSRWSPPGPPKPMMQAPPRQRQPGEEGDELPPMQDVPFDRGPR